MNSHDTMEVWKLAIDAAMRVTMAVALCITLFFIGRAILRDEQADRSDGD